MFGLEEELDQTQLEARVLIEILDREIGRRRMSLELRLQVEKLEELLPDGHYW
jgi:hypothetical protein